eukprot:CAMPEP_0170312220 /NCGR_PEP_ID=MMETSP0116_2-20130129/56641_1 /TAXON_ID=400756 /ORGANISM="Durinskia baltica, Strain CSIRO CS-38" /LENGTH=74 /DNA_ID=CAMNT_0010564585 /DNA_START=117 /DNA_END=337 /DNA_ORIENTATION=+
MSDLPDEGAKIFQTGPEKSRTGPIVIHVQDPTTMATITARGVKRRGKMDRLWIVGGLAIFVFLGIFWETTEDLS